MNGRNCSYTLRSRVDVRNIDRWYKMSILSERNVAACFEILHTCAISSGLCRFSPHKTQAGARIRAATWLAAVSCGSSFGAGSRLEIVTIPGLTCPKIIWPISCPIVKRTRPCMQASLYRISGTFSTKNVNPSMLAVMFDSRCDFIRWLASP